MTNEELGERLNHFEKRLNDLYDCMNEIKVDMAGFKGRFIAYGSIGVAATSGLVSFIVSKLAG